MTRKERPLPAGASPGPGQEATFLAQAAAGEPSAVAWLLDEVAPTVYGFIYARVTGDEAAAEDILQETLLEAVKSAGSFRGESTLSTWMCTIARRRLGRYYEGQRKAGLAQAGLRVLEGTQAPPPGHEAGYDLQDEVLRALAKLPALQRQVLVLKYIDDLPVHDIAKYMGRTQVQVQSLLQRGRESLRRQLEEMHD